MQKENEALSFDDYIEKYQKKITELEEESNIQRKIDYTLDLLRGSKDEIDNALQNGNIKFVWDKVENGNSYAEYILDTYYSYICEKAIDDYNISALSKKLSEVEIYAKAGNVFAEYIINFNLYKMYAKKNTSLASKSAQIIIDIAQKNNNVSAMAMVGLWGCGGYNHATHTEADGVKLLMRCAELYHPKAMFWLGQYYRTGAHGLPIDNNQARYYLTIAADYEVPYAKHELEKLNNDNTSSSSCYITTAVCTSFGKPDDCYELRAFRDFRDGWLKNQIGGGALIQEYYETAPKIIAKIDSKEDSAIIYRHVWETYLSKCLSFIETNEFEKCKRLYVCMVEDMKHKYL